MTTHELQFYVSGMKCEGCAATVKKTLEGMAGITEAEVDLANGEARAQGDVDPQAACQLLAEAGYPAVVKSAKQ